MIESRQRLAGSTLLAVVLLDFRFTGVIGMRSF